MAMLCDRPYRQRSPNAANVPPLNPVAKQRQDGGCQREIGKERTKKVNQ